MKRLYGVTVAMITPFTKDGRIDHRALKDYTEMLIEKGVDCLYPCGTTGEMIHLSGQERREVAETVIQTAAGRVNVFIHCGAVCQKETEALLEHAYRIGADGAGIVTPMFLGVTDYEMEEYYKRMARIVPDEFPVYLYNIPQCSANDLKVRTVEKLAKECKNIIGIKYSYPDFLRTLEYLEIPSFSVLHGCDKMFSELLLMGCDGTVSGVAGVFPEPFVEVYKAWKLKRIEEMQKWQRICIRFCNLLRCGSNMSWFKLALELRGMTAGGMRNPQKNLPFSEADRTMQELKGLCEESGISLRL